MRPQPRPWKNSSRVAGSVVLMLSATMSLHTHSRDGAARSIRHEALGVWFSAVFAASSHREPEPERGTPTGQSLERTSLIGVSPFRQKAGREQRLPRGSEGCRAQGPNAGSNGPIQCTGRIVSPSQSMKSRQCELSLAFQLNERAWTKEAQRSSGRGEQKERQTVRKIQALRGWSLNGMNVREFET